jgi:hypothetical protein
VKGGGTGRGSEEGQKAGRFTKEKVLNIIKAQRQKKYNSVDAAGQANTGQVFSVTRILEGLGGLTGRIQRCEWRESVWE